MKPLRYEVWITSNPDVKKDKCFNCDGRGSEVCDECWGIGVDPDDDGDCTRCNGDGRISCTVCNGFGHSGLLEYQAMVKRETALYNQWQGVKANDKRG